MKNNLQYFLNKYAITFLLFLFYVLLISNNDVFTQYKNVRKLSELTTEREVLKIKIEEDRKALNELTTNMESLEKFARENYLMKKNGEELFVVVVKKETD